MQLSAETTSDLPSLFYGRLRVCGAKSLWTDISKKFSNFDRQTQKYSQGLWLENQASAFHLGKRWTKDKHAESNKRTNRVRNS